MSGIYLHVPFCRKACNYCDFHFSTSFKTYDEVVRTMRAEIEFWADSWNEPVQTIYFGGGTPSTLKEEDFQLLMDAIRASYTVAADAEVTMEVNPEDVTKQRLRHWKNCGVNRLSMGIQSFYEDELQWMNRNHTADKSSTAIAWAQEVGFENITIDLIYGVPISNMERWKSNVNKAISSGVPHLSCYALTVEDKTALSHLIAKGAVKAPDEDEAHQQFLFLREALKDAGYEHYEISNFGKPGKHSVHNSNYWNGVPYLGIGPGAHSYNGSIRRWNINNNHLYATRFAEEQPWYEIEELTTRDRYNEWVMTSLRRAVGISRLEVENRFGKAYGEQLAESAQGHVLGGYVEWKEDHLVLTEKGMFFADGITVDLMDA